MQRPLNKSGAGLVGPSRPTPQHPASVLLAGYILFRQPMNTSI